MITDQSKDRRQPQGANEITKNTEAENEQAKRIADAEAKRSQIEGNRTDVPQDHPAWKCLRLEKMDTVAAAVGTNMNGENIRIQVTAMQAKGSINTAARICRLCYARLLQGDSKEETTEYRQQLLRQLPDKQGSYQEIDVRQMIDQRKSKGEVTTKKQEHKQDNKTENNDNNNKRETGHTEGHNKIKEQHGTKTIEEEIFKLAAEIQEAEDEEKAKNKHRNNKEEPEDPAKESKGRREQQENKKHKKTPEGEKMMSTNIQTALRKKYKR